MAFTAKDVAELRKQTGCGMMDCKKALVESNGDFEAAVKYLREKGMAATAKKADRIAAEGIVDILTIDNTTAIVEVNSETDFVAKNATFQEFVKEILKTIIANKPADVDALLASNYVGGGLVSEALAEQIYKIGEKLSIRRFEIVEGTVSSYIHGMGATGVIVSFETDVADKDGFAECAKNVALQTAAMEVKYLDKESVPASVLAEEEAILINQMKEDPKMANKPEAVLANIVNIDCSCISRTSPITPFSCYPYQLLFSITWLNPHFSTNITTFTFYFGIYIYCMGSCPRTTNSNYYTD